MSTDTAETIVLRAPGGWGAISDPTTEERRDIPLPSVESDELGSGHWRDKKLLELRADEVGLAEALLESNRLMRVYDDPAGLLGGDDR